MKTTHTFIAHPISGDIQGNIKKIYEILRVCTLLHPTRLFVAPYLVTLNFLDDNDPKDRDLGISINEEYFRSGFIDEVWLFGNTLSLGMKHEVDLADQLKIKVTPWTLEMNQLLEDYRKYR